MIGNVELVDDLWMDRQLEKSGRWNESSKSEHAREEADGPERLRYNIVVIRLHIGYLLLNLVLDQVTPSYLLIIVHSLPM